jgi:uncharacterized protein
MRYRGAMDPTATPLSSADMEGAEKLLRDAPIAYLAMVEPGGPYVIPLNFVYVGYEGHLDGRMYFHTGEGRKSEALAADPRVCIAVTAGVAFDQGDSPCADGFAYRSLLLWGQARQIHDRDGRETVLRAIVAKYDPAAAGAPFEEADFAQTLLYEVIIETAGYKERPARRAS